MAIKRKTLQEMFHGHVVSKVRDEEIWRYWVFTSIMGHFVHSFNSEVDSTGNMDDLQNTATEWIKERMSLQQLRKGKLFYYISFLCIYIYTFLHDICRLSLNIFSIYI